MSHSIRHGSQAENAGSIPVARSRLDFVVTTDKVVGNIAFGFSHCSSLFAPIRHVSLSQHGRNATTGSKPRFALPRQGGVRFPIAGQSLQKTEAH